MLNSTPDGGNTATFILLSFARPQNMQRVVNTIRKANSCGRVILSNNQPDIDIFDHIDPPLPGLEVIQQEQQWGPVKRFCIARECKGEHFVCLDDDIFLTPLQIDKLVGHLVENPSRPHGIGGEIIKRQDGKLTVLRGRYNFSGEVSTLNRVYAFTRKHVRRYFQLLEKLGIEDPRDLGPADDIVLSFCGNGWPKCHDLGPFENCPTARQKGVALWRAEGFYERRMEIFVRLLDLVREK